MITPPGTHYQFLIQLWSNHPVNITNPSSGYDHTTWHTLPIPHPATITPPGTHYQSLIQLWSHHLAHITNPSSNYNHTTWHTLPIPHPTMIKPPSKHYQSLIQLQSHHLANINNPSSSYDHTTQQTLPSSKQSLLIYGGCCSSRCCRNAANSGSSRMTNISTTQAGQNMVHSSLTIKVECYPPITIFTFGGLCPPGYFKMLKWKNCQ